MTHRTVEHRSVLPLPPALVWARVTTVAGIRDELRPWLSMTLPPGLRGRDVADLEDQLGRPLGRAWLLALGVLPVEYDDMQIVSLEPGHSFHERSRMLTLPRWEHHRSVEPVGASSSSVHDVLGFTPRVPPGGVVAARVVTSLFAHRHRRLRRWAEAERARRGLENAESSGM